MVEAVRAHARTRPDQPALSFLDHGQVSSGVTETLTYHRLDQRARVVAERLTAGDRVAIVCPQGLDYVAAFLGCLYAGAVAIPSHAPEPFRSDAGLTAILADSRPQLLLTTGEHRAAVSALSDVPALCVDEFPGDTGWQPSPPDLDTVAYLQYTSGSTGSPRGVVLSHGNLAWSARQCRQAYGVDENSRLVIW